MTICFGCHGEYRDQIEYPTLPSVMSRVHLAERQYVLVRSYNLQTTLALRNQYHIGIASEF